MVPDLISMNYGGNVEKKNRNKNYGVGKAVLLLRIFCACLHEIRLSRLPLNFPALINGRFVKVPSLSTKGLFLCLSKEEGLRYNDALRARKMSYFCFI